MSRTYNPEGRSHNQRFARCGHDHCKSCATRRGRRFGNRRDRHDTRSDLRRLAGFDTRQAVTLYA